MSKSKKRMSSSKSIGSNRRRSVSDTQSEAKKSSIQRDALPILSLSSLDNIDHISSSSSSSLLTPNTKSHLILTNPTDDIMDYGILNKPRNKEEEETFKDIVNTKYDAFEPYKKGSIKTNKYYFTDVQFCFICDTDTIEFQPNACIEKTGIRLNKLGYYEPSYKQLFCCDECYINIQETKKNNKDYNVIIHKGRTLSYY